MFSKICRGKKIFLFVPWAFSKKKVKTSFCLHVNFGQPLQNRLFCLRTGFPTPEGKDALKSNFLFIVILTRSELKDSKFGCDWQKACICHPLLAKRVFSAVFAHFFAVMFRSKDLDAKVNTTRRVGQYIVSFCFATPVLSVLTARETPFFVTFFQCAKTDILILFPNNQLQSVKGIEPPHLLRRQ